MRPIRVLHVAPYVSADGSYGGPVSVALDQADALARAGCDVTVVAGWDGVADVVSAARVRTFRARRPLGPSFAGLVSPRLLIWLFRHRREFDVAHVHMTRDLLTLPAARLLIAAGVAVVVQTHGQVRATRSRRQALLDLAMTRRVFARASAVLVLTGHEAEDLAAQRVPDHSMVRVDNGVPAAVRHARAGRTPPLVLFNSRLAERKRPLAFLETAELVHREAPDVVFELWGPDEGELAEVLAVMEARGMKSFVKYCGATTPAEARERLADATVMILPSRAEPFPMTLLEAMAAGLPSVITDETGLSQTCQSTGAAIVTDGTPAEMAAAVLVLVKDPDRWLSVSVSSRGVAEGRFAVAVVAERLLGVYEDVARAVKPPQVRRPLKPPTRRGA